ncbi:hypothetical protein AXF42_Ash015036 [Apostasia shenzhenica]|uniref:Uncharacterized protein n=1 Tax=Apostasia shenzhenica TaxID=1088818 RepID=A0A2I0B2Y1_9ASPA|nr:hypothetical protein AXF42_Ash015036 [Apostasia shenzhenica]
MDLQISHYLINIATNLTTIGILKCVTIAPILAKFLGLPHSAKIGKERTRCTPGGAAAGGVAISNTNSIKYIWTITIKKKKKPTWIKNEIIKKNVAFPVKMYVN